MKPYPIIPSRYINFTYGARLFASTIEITPYSSKSAKPKRIHHRGNRTSNNSEKKVKPNLPAKDVGNSPNTSEKPAPWIKTEAEKEFELLLRKDYLKSVEFLMSSSEVSIRSFDTILQFVKERNFRQEIFVELVNR